MVHLFPQKERILVFLSEVGKDADIVISTGSILDPRCYVVNVLIDGAVAYDIKKDKRRF